ncbi:hypothetical protein IE53DRAFT_368274 [Violaceomyces palustris]|uniref:Uncharacterized protein n=1 Tax=Violaceomyces palustris TaxID=1673888 RepID=A0ACD0NZK5_9BASI|nr:hypothetical protein IE53DRAFT_368274 [Violaceomyces palustris]
MAFRRTLGLFKELLNSSSFASTSTSKNILTSHLSKDVLPPTFQTSELPHKTLYQHLSTLPNDGVGSKVRQRRWLAKGLDQPAHINLREDWEKFRASGAEGRNAVKQAGHLCYWEVTRVRLKNGGNNGKAWGRLFWRGKQVTPPGKDERISGGLKYHWDTAN